MLAEQRNEMIANCFRPGVKNGHYYPLMPRHGAYLLDFKSKGERFARLFRETWVRIPLYARRYILKHWKSDDVLRFAVRYSPSIELADTWDGKKPGDAGWAHRGGHSLRFARRRVEKMPDEVVCDLIAHELAHVFQWAIGEDLNSLDAFNIEIIADEIMESWGFDAESIDRWAVGAGVTKFVDVDKLTESQKKRLRARAKRAGRGIGLFL